MQEGSTLTEYFRKVFPPRPAAKAAPEVKRGETPLTDSILAATAPRAFGLDEIAEETAVQQDQRCVSILTELFESGRGNDLPGARGTAWAAYNAVTEWVTHER